MTKRVLILMLALLCGGVALTPVAHGHPYLYYGPIDGSGNTENPEPWANLLEVANDYEVHVGAMMTPTTGGTSGCNLWIGACAQPAIWQSVKGQQGPSWDTVSNGADGAYNYTGNGSLDVVKFQMLDEVLSTSTCLDGIALNTVNAIRTAWTANKTAAENAEITLGNVRIRSNFTYMGIGAAVDTTMTITTGGSTSDIPVTAGILGTVYTIPPQAIPNLFKTSSSLLRSANRYIRDATVNMASAYMTIGDTRIANYWYAYMGTMGTVAVNQMLPSLLAGIGKSDEATLTAADLGSAFTLALGAGLRNVAVTPGDPSDKAAVACSPWGTINDLDITVPVTVDAIGTINIRITQSGGDLCNSIIGFAQKFQIGPGKFEGRSQYLATDGTGNLNGDARLNLASYTLASADANLYLQYEGARPNFTAGTLAAPPAKTYGSTHLFTSSASYNGSTAGISYQWYSSPDNTTWTAIQFANGPTYTAPVNFYSFGGTNNDRYYKCVASVNCAGSPYNRETNVVSITNVPPPPITFSNATGAGNYAPGATVALSTDATVGYGGPLTYQWQKYNGSAWVDLAGKTAKTLNLPNIQPSDAGQYRLVAFNAVAPNPVYWQASALTITLAVAPAIVFSTQPVGADLAIGGSHTMTVAASVTSGTLTYQWQRNVGFGWQNISGQTGTSLALSGVTVNDAGSYRCVVTNTLVPYTPYTANSSAAVVNVSSGAVYRVDPTTSGAQNGLTWPTAFRTLQAAIDAAANDVGGNGGEVWVAGGSIGAPIVYNELRTEAWGTTSVTGSLVMKNNVAMYGGFSGYRSGTGVQETRRRDRNRHQYPSVIDGSLARGGSPAYHVVVFGRGAAPTTNATLDGFGITGGNASGVAGDYHTWRGGGVYNWQSAPTIANCTFYGNTAAVSGGAIANETNLTNNAAAQLINCLFHGNIATRAADTANNPIRGGGAVFCNMADVRMTWNTFAANNIGTPAYTLFGAASGAVYVWEANPILASSVVWDNLPAGPAAQEDVVYGSTKVPVVTYTNTQGGAIGGTGNISANPLFTDAPGLDFTLAAGSPSVDTGDPALMGDDLRGVPRPIDGGVAAVCDMGAYELSPNGPAPACLAQSIDLGVATTITDPLNVFDSTNSEVEAGLWTLSLNPNTFVCVDIPLKAAGVTLVATDVLGRTGTCSADVTVSESVPPTAVASPITVTLNAAGSYTLTQTDIQAIGAGSSDNCSVNWPACTVSPSTFNCAQAGTSVSVTLTIRDGSGNSATANTLLPVQDTTAPTATGGNNINVNLSSAGDYTLTFSDKQALGAGSTDGCGINWAASTVVPNAFDCGDLAGPVTVAVTLVDVNGNPAAPVSGTVTVHDVTAGILNGVAAQAFTKLSGAYTAARALTGVTASDLCDGDITAGVTVAAFDGATPVPFPVPDTAASYPKVYTLRYTATDGSGNAASVDTTLTLSDNTPPVITILGANPVNLQCNDVYSDAGATALDAESGDLTSFIGVVGLPVPTGSAGSHNVTYSVQDPVTGLVVQAVRIVNVADTTAPVITGLPKADVTAQGDPYTLAEALALVSANDACAGDVTALMTVAAFDGATPVAFPIAAATGGKTYTLNYSAPDGNGNTRTGSGTVYVNARPTVTVSGTNPDTVECKAVYGDAGATAADLESGNLTSSIVITGTPVNTNTLGPKTVTYTVTDPVTGAVVVATRTVTVVDTTGPVFSGLATGWTQAQGTTFALATAAAGVTANDACAGNRTPNIVITALDGATPVTFPITLAAGKTYTIRYTVADGNGNTTVNDRNLVTNNLPVITVTGSNPATVECKAVYGDAGATATDTESGNLTASIVTTGMPVNTNSVATRTVTYTLTDPVTGAVVIATRTVSVVDTAGPVFSGLATSWTQAQGTTFSMATAAAGVTANDACAGDRTANIVITALDGATPVTFPITLAAGKTYTIRYTVADGNGNTTVQNRSLVTNNLPVITVTGSNPATVECKAVYGDAGATATDTESGNLTASIVTTGMPVNTNSIATRTVTYTLTDPVTSAVVTTTRTVSVVDTTGPVFSGLATGWTQAQGTTFALAAASVGVTANDACAGDRTANIVITALDGATPVTFPITLAAGKTYTIRYTVADGNGNTTVQNRNLVTNNLPVITVTGSNPATAECGAVYGDAGATATDTESGSLTAAIVVSGMPVDTSSMTPKTVTYTVTDPVTGAIVTANRTVNVADTTAPVFSGLPKTDSMGKTQTYTLASALSGVGALDACAGNRTAFITVTADILGVPETFPISKPSSPPYPITVNLHYSVNDGNGNTRTGSGTLTINDQSPPTITITGSNPATVECKAAYGDAGATAVSELGANLTSAIVTTGLPVSTAAPGSHTVTYTCTDPVNGLTAIKTRTVNVVDTTAPVFAGLPTGWTRAQGTTFTLADASTGVTASDVCAGDRTSSIVVTVLDGATPVTLPLALATAPKTYTVRYSVVDGNGNSASQDRTLTVNALPVITVTGDNPATAECKSTYSDAGATVVDSESAGLTAVTSGMPLDTNTLGPKTVTYTVTDPVTNAVVTATRTVNVVDTAKPVLNGVPAGWGRAEGALFTYADASAGVTASDVCAGDVTSFIIITAFDGATPLTFPITMPAAPATYTIRYRVDDGNGNNAYADRSLTVNAAPVITVTGDNPATAECKGVYSDAGATASDAESGNLSASVVTTGMPVDTNTLGPKTVTYTVTDPLTGQVVTATRTVNVVDTTDPVISNVPAGWTRAEGTTFTLAEASSAGATAADLCAGDVTGDITVAAFDGASPVSFPITLGLLPASYTIRYSVDDGNGNTATADTTLTVNALPVITVTGDNPAAAECTLEYLDAGATVTDAESTGLTATLVSGMPVDTSASGTAATITYTVTDPVTNAVVTATRTVDVVDTTAPVITLLGGSPYAHQRGIAWSDPGYTATDSCGGDLTGSVVVTGAVNINAMGSYPLFYNVTDGTNAAAPESRMVIVGDIVQWVAHPDDSDLYQDAPVSAPVTLTAEFINGMSVTTYQWLRRPAGGGAVTAMTGALAVPPSKVLTLTVSAGDLPAGEYEIYAVVNDSAGANASDAALVRLSNHMACPGLTNVTIGAGDNFDWPVTVNGGIGTVSYQWFKEGAKAMAPLSDGGGLSGTGTATLHFANFDDSMAGLYKVEASDANETIVIGPANVYTNAGVPVGGALGLAALAALTALGGAASLRRRNK